VPDLGTVIVPVGGGYFFAPTVLLNVDDAMLLSHEETFGPVAGLLTFDTEEEVIARANDTAFGLAAYYFTRDVGRVWRLAEQLEASGMQVLDAGSQVQLAPDRAFHDAVAQLVQPERLPRLTQEQAEVLAIVISDGMASRRRIEEVRGATRRSLRRGGPGALMLASSRVRSESSNSC